MITIFWNFRGLGQALTIRALRELCNSHRPNMIFLYEVKSYNLSKIQNITLSLKFDEVHLVPSHGSSGGLALMWVNTVDVQIVSSTKNLISALILNDLVSSPWQLTRVYGPTILKLEFWESLHRIGDAFNGPWIIRGISMLC